MKKLALTFIVYFMVFALFAQKQFTLVNALKDQTTYNSAVTLSDESFLLVMNHTRQDTSLTELLKLNNDGDTLAHRFINLEGYTSAASAVAVNEGVVLAIGTATGCRYTSNEYGFTFIRLDNKLIELKRKSYLDSSLTQIPFGPVKYADHKFYCFDWDRVNVFDDDFNIIESHLGFQYYRSKDFDVINNKIICTSYDSTGIEIKSLNGNTLEFINRSVANDIVIYNEEIYVGVELSILKLDESLQVLDSVVTYARYGSVYTPHNMIRYKDELVVIQNEETFSRYTMPDLKVINNTYGTFKYDDWRFTPYYFWGGGFVANANTIGKFSVTWEDNCGIQDPYDYHLCYFETSQVGVTTDRYYLENVTVDEVWIDSLTRYPDYEAYEFDLHIGVKVTNDADEELNEFDLGIHHNLDTGCINPNNFIKSLHGLNIGIGKSETFHFTDLRLNPGKDFDSLYLDITSKVITQNRKMPSHWDFCAYTWQFIRKNQIVEKERPTPVKIPKYTVFPNPTTEILIFDGKLPVGAEVRVYNIAGKLIFEKRFDIDETDWKLDVSRLPDALYLLEIKNSYFNKVSKFVKQ